MNPTDGPDPLNLGDVDQQIRINELEEQLSELGMVETKIDDDCPPDVKEQFLRSVMEFETAPKSSWFSRLESSGVSLPPTASLDDAGVHAKLRQIFEALAGMSTFVSSTDHLSDRELYEHLWSDSLREVGMVGKPGSGWINYIDLIGSGSDEDTELWQKYYMTDEQRAHWAKDFPDDVMPAKEKPPFDRDRLLPKAPDPPMMSDEDFDTFENGEFGDEEPGDKEP
jgi:hypothetical protein